ncbi:MAG TPA: PstS family phosphate ABC transporter substrate-binding protein [Oculatellaceae cyanobacterium]|jgi:phosphate transport system substrate-binding protein
MAFMLKRVSLLSAIALVASTLGVPISPVQSITPGTVQIDGSSTVYPITEAVAEEFQKKGGGRATVGISGTGGGFKKFCRNEIDIADASRPILAKEMAACRAAGVQYIELPVAYDALTVVVNRQSPVSNLTTAELKKMWEPTAQGRVSRWNQVRAGLPNAPLRLYGAGPDSGTFDYFTEAIVGKSKSSRRDYTPSEDDNVLVQGVARDKNALGYFGYAYYRANTNRLKAVSINGVLPSAQTVRSGKYQPLSRPIFIYVNAKSLQRPEVKKFTEYYMNNASRLSAAVGYVALPANGYAIAKQHLQKRKVGTVFAGDAPVGLRIEALLQREAKF